MKPTHLPVPIRIESFSGARSDLLPLFEMADDSADQIRSYIELGEVLVARYRQHIMGHVQVLSGAAEREIKSIAVLGEYRGHGIGSALIRAACNQALAEGDLRIAVATATADIGNLRFYQRLGFRMVRIEQDAFSKEKGYSSVTVDGIPVRDKVWLSIDLEDIASSCPWCVVLNCVEYWSRVCVEFLPIIDAHIQRVSASISRKYGLIFDAIYCAKWINFECNSTPARFIEKAGQI